MLEPSKCVSKCLCVRGGRGEVGEGGGVGNTGICVINKNIILQYLLYRYLYLCPV